MNEKKLIAFGVMGILAMIFVTAGVIDFFGQVQQEVTVDQAVDFIGMNMAEAIISGGESVTSNDLNVESKTSVIVPLDIETTTDLDEEGITHTVNYLLSSTGFVGTSNENRIFIRAEDTLVTTLDSLDSISWDVDGTGYIAHVDVFLDNGETLVFEYAKVAAPCDNIPYPTGVQDTFGDKGIVDGGAMAWLSSGVPGYCGLPEFNNNHKSLIDWKAFYPTANVLAFEIETDNWIMDSESNVKNIKINDADIEVSLKPLDSLDFNVETTFGFLNVGDYTITTTVNPRA